jgi:NADH dehydrogenase
VEEGAFRVVVVGAGFGGYYAARTLCRKLDESEASITLVSDSDGMLYQPLLPDVAVGAIDPRAANVPLNSTLRRASVVRGRATGVDLEVRAVDVASPSGPLTIPYDYLLLAPGGVTRTFDIPGLAEHAIGFKTTAEALYLRERVLARIEAANASDSPPAAPINFIVVGAGYAGTELAAQMSRLTDHLLPTFPNVGEVRWLLIDHSQSVMPELGHWLGERAVTLLRRRGVDVRHQTSIARIDGGAVELTDGTVIQDATVIWCAGVAANPLISTLGLPVTKGRLVVSPTLDVPDHPSLFAVGDAAAVPDASQPAAAGAICPPTAQHAMRQGPAAARNIIARIRGRDLRAYRHRDLGLVVDLGGAGAVAKPLGIPLSGWPAKAVTRGYHVYALPTARRRLTALTGWALAGRRPDDVSFGLLDLEQALAARSEHSL